MFGHRDLHRVIVPTIAVALVATVCAGATFASTKKSSAKACVTKNGYLALPSSKGKCPSHTTKLSLSKTGPAGKPGTPGKTGPSNGYDVTNSMGVTISTTPTVATLPLPAGAYLLASQVTVANADTASTAFVGCHFADGTLTSMTGSVTVPEGVVVGATSAATAASVSLVSALSLPSAGSVSVTCSGGQPGDVFASAAVTAQLVGALSTSGNPTFAPPPN